MSGLMTLEQAHEVWDSNWWHNFTPEEIACRCNNCGHEVYICERTLDAVQYLRERIRRPVNITSGHRCSIHNARVGGAPRSGHLKLALDLSLRGQNRFNFRAIAREAGFIGMGFYVNFLHVDVHSERHWFGGRKAEQLWQS